MWYGQTPNASIQAVVDSYLDAVGDEEASVATPWYTQLAYGPLTLFREKELADDLQQGVQADVDGSVVHVLPRDTCFGLLQLACQPEIFPLHSVLAPSGYTPDPLDYSLAVRQLFGVRVDGNAASFTTTLTHTRATRRLVQWHLYVTLQGVQACAPLAFAQFYRLTMSYAAQLEIDGLWHWAIYVVLRMSMVCVSRLPAASRCRGVALPAATTKPVSAVHRQRKLTRQPSWVSRERF